MKTIKPIYFFIAACVLTIAMLTLFSGCRSKNLPFMSVVSKTNSHEVQLGTSNYYVLLPSNFTISEARGKEGQLGYNIISKDTSSTKFGFIEIRRGRPIGGDLYNKANSELFVKTRLADKKVQWKITTTENGYYQAFTSENGDLNAQVSSKLRTDIDTLVSIIASLNKK
jgi:hypothetical protein